MSNHQEIAVNLVETAMRKGATAAEVMVFSSNSFSVSVRLGAVETLQESTSQQLGLRVIWEGRQANIATSDLRPAALAELVDDAVALARATSVDDQLSLPDQQELASDWPDLALCDPQMLQVPPEERINLALRAEAAARAVDPRIINFEGGGFDLATRAFTLANSLGFAGSYEGSSCSLATVPIASENGQMQRDYWYDNQRFFQKLMPAEAIGEKAAERTLRRLGAKKVKTQIAPVVYDPLTAANLLGNLLQAVSGDAIARKASFLVGKLGEKIANSQLTVIDDGRLVGALGSRPFDSDGLPTRRTVVVENGTLTSYLLNTYTARKLGLKSTGNAARSLSSPPSITCNNLFIAPGKYAPTEIIGSVKAGLYVTDLIGFGVNQVTGDYSLGAAGIWIENGVLTYPVEEVTIASNLKDMLQQIEMIGNDLIMRDRICAPTLKIEKMTISGE